MGLPTRRLGLMSRPWAGPDGGFGTQWLEDKTALSSWIATDCANQSRERESANDDTVAANGVVAENETRANAIRYCAHLDRS